MSKVDNIQAPVTAPAAGGKRSLDSIRDMIGLTSAGAGIFIALFYLAGRSFAGGYFEAMNIPVYMVTFSIQEYGEVGWLPLLLYPTAIMFLGGLFWFVIYEIGNWLSPVSDRLKDWLKKRTKNMLLNRKPNETSKEAQRTGQFMRFTFVVLTIILLTISTMQLVHDQGFGNGQFMVLEKATRVELVSAIPMTLDNVNVVTAQIGQNENQYYIYSGFHLLTVNNGQYYLFKEIDPVICKPLKVYVIDANQYKQVNLLVAESLSSQCQKNASTKQPAAPTVPPTSTP